MFNKFNKNIAKETTITKAVILDYLIEESNILEIKEGDEAWINITTRELSEILFYISESAIKKSILELQKEEYLKSKNLNRTKFDQSKWYLVTNKAKKFYTKEMSYKWQKDECFQKKS